MRQAVMIRIAFTLSGLASAAAFLPTAIGSATGQVDAWQGRLAETSATPDEPAAKTWEGTLYGPVVKATDLSTKSPASRPAPTCPVSPTGTAVAFTVPASTPLHSVVGATPNPRRCIHRSGIKGVLGHRFSSFVDTIFPVGGQLISTGAQVRAVLSRRGLGEALGSSVGEDLVGVMEQAVDAGR